MKAIWIPFIIMIAALFVGCSEKSTAEVPSEEVFYSYVRANNYSILVGGLDSNKEIGFQLDTITLSSLILNCDIKDSSFDCIKKIYCNPSETESISDNRDTVYLNYGDKRISDFSFEVDVPALDSARLQEIFSEFGSSSVCTVLVDSISTNYFLEAHGLPKDIVLVQSVEIDGLYWSVLPDTASDKNVEYCLNQEDEFSLHCSMWSVCTSMHKKDDICMEEEFTMAPLVKDLLMQREYSLISTEYSLLPPDTIVNWTLVYTDQYGRSDSLEMKTLFK